MATAIQALIALIIVLAGWIQKKKPPKTINAWYGYRTGRAMRTQEAWDFAQHHSARMMIRYGFICGALAPLWLLMDANSTLYFLIATVLSSGCLLIPIWLTEQKLKKKFG